MLDEDGEPVVILEIYDNGRQKVGRLVDADGEEYGMCTPTHKFLGVDGLVQAQDMDEGEILQTWDFDEDCRGEIEIFWEGVSSIRQTYNLHVASNTNLYPIEAGNILSKNLGKSAVGSRITSWFFTEEFPGWTRPEEWGTGPIGILMLCRNTKQIEEVLWHKIRMLLPEGSYEIKRRSGAIVSIVHKKTGNKIIPLSYENPKQARERAQGFVFNFVWMDELCEDVTLLEELQKRVLIKGGYFLATFSPKRPAPLVKRVIDNANEPLAKVYRFQALQNPVFANNPDKYQEFVDSMKDMPPEVKNAALYGEWMSDNDNIFNLELPGVVLAPDEDYHHWPCVLSVDPANTSATGYTFFSQDPTTGHWYITAAGTIKGTFSPNELAVKVKELYDSRPNLIRAVYDPSAAWFYLTAREHNMKFIAPFNKTQEKQQMLVDFQDALGDWLHVAPWCTAAIDELGAYRRNPDNPEKIVKAQKYHIVDSCVYGCNMLPKLPEKKKDLTYAQQLRKEHEDRQRREEAVKKRNLKIQSRRRFGRRRR